VKQNFQDRQTPFGRGTGQRAQLTILKKASLI